jgi:hypothetical protein
MGWLARYAALQLASLVTADVLCGGGYLFHNASQGCIACPAGQLCTSADALGASGGVSLLARDSWAPVYARLAAPAGDAGHELAELLRPAAHATTALAWSPNARYLAAISRRRALTVWDAAEPAPE